MTVTETTIVHMLRYLSGANVNIGKDTFQAKVWLDYLQHEAAWIDPPMIQAATRRVIRNLGETGRFATPADLVAAARQVRRERAEKEKQAELRREIESEENRKPYLPAWVPPWLEATKDGKTITIEQLQQLQTQYEEKELEQ